MTDYYKLILAALSCGGISFTITFTSIFSGFRELVAKMHKKLEQLIFCPWCLNHYVVAIFLLTSDLDYIVVSKYVLYNFLVTLFAMVSIGGLLHYVLVRAYEPVHKNMLMRSMEKLQNK